MCQTKITTCKQAELSQLAVLMLCSETYVMKIVQKYPQVLFATADRAFLVQGRFAYAVCLQR